MLTHLFTRFTSGKRLPLFLLISLLSAPVAAQNSALDDAALEKKYRAAVQDAATAEPSERVKNLVAIVPSNHNLIWKNKDDAQNAKVLVVTWTNYNGYDDKENQTITLSREVWVTTAPEIKHFCTTLQENRTLRLEQLLGLPPKSGKTKFVEMWVKPSDLFRPSADPEISDSEAEITFRQTNRFVTLSAEYVQWYNNLQQVSYGEKGYPWTRLGYTYDWGNSNSEVGVSEFVILPGASVEIHTISTTTEY